MTTGAGAAQPVALSTDAPLAGPALPVAVVSDGRPTLAGPSQPVVVVTSGPVQAGPALPVVLGAASTPVAGGRPIPVYVVSGSLSAGLLSVRTGTWYYDGAALRGGGQAVPVWGASEARDGSVSRANGVAFAAVVLPEDAAADLVVGLSSSAVGGVDPRTLGHQIVMENGNLAMSVAGATFVLDSAGRALRPMQYLWCIVLFAEGAVGLISAIGADSGTGMADPRGIPAYPSAAVFPLELTNTTATLYPSASAYDTLGYPGGHLIQGARVIPSVASWASADAMSSAIDRFKRANSTISPGGAITVVRGTWGINLERLYLVAKAGGGWDGVWLAGAPSDGTFIWDLTVSASYTPGTPNTFAFGTFRRVDNNNYWRIGINNAQALSLQVFEGGGNPSATLVNGSYAWAAGGRYRIVCKAYGNRYQAWVHDLVNNTVSQPWGNTWQTDASSRHLAGTGIGASGGGTVIDNYYDTMAAYPLTLALPTEITSGAHPVVYTTGATLASDTFVDANGTRLNAHTAAAGGPWTEQPGSTWTIQGNQLTVSGAGALYATQNVGATRAQARITINTPASATTVRCGIVARYTSGLVALVVRAFKDPSQPGADEIEVEEGAGGSIPVVHKVNLGTYFGNSAAYSLLVQVGADPDGGNDLIHVWPDGFPRVSFKLSQNLPGVQWGVYVEGGTDSGSKLSAWELLAIS